MTKVVITKKDNRIVQVECDGHTGYGCEGEDIVCAALSSIVQTAVLGLFQVAGVNIGFTRNDSNGYLKIKIPNDVDDQQKHDCEVILKTMFLGISDLHEGFSDYVELEVK